MRSASTFLIYSTVKLPGSAAFLKVLYAIRKRKYR